MNLEEKRYLRNYVSKLTKEYQESQKELKYLKKYQENIVTSRVTKKVIIIEKEYRKKLETYQKENKKILLEKDHEIEALKKQIAKMQSQMDNDASNSGIPTSKTPIGKKKYIPNLREKTDKKIGAQKGHKAHKLKAFCEEEATEIIEVVPEVCPNCQGKDIEVLDSSINKCEIDYEVKVIKRQHKYKNCHCRKCNKDFHAPIPNNLKEACQYGSTVKALSICLNNEFYTPYNKVVKLIKDMTENEITMSEGYVVKLQKQASEKLKDFMKELTDHIIKSEVIGWDDGVVSVSQKDGILRTYCTDNLVLFFAHEKKDENSIKEDGILTRLPSSSFVMHDHLLHNYNEKYNYKNVECLIHLIRRLKKMQNNTNHSWCKSLEELLSQTNKDRNAYISNKKETFEKAYLEQLNTKYDEILSEGLKTNEEDKNNYFTAEEIKFLKDLKKYKENYLLWVYNFNLPSTNNNSERNIRPVKSKMKISGQFKNISAAKYYATIRSYIETCKRNNVNIVYAIKQLIDGNCLSLSDILAHKNNDLK